MIVVVYSYLGISPIYKLFCFGKVNENCFSAKRGKEFHIYEVKCSFRLTKAKMQLGKIRRKTQDIFNITNCYFYCGSNATLVPIEEY